MGIDGAKDSLPIEGLFQRDIRTFLFLCDYSCAKNIASKVRIENKSSACTILVTTIKRGSKALWNISESDCRGLQNLSLMVSRPQLSSRHCVISCHFRGRP